MRDAPRDAASIASSEVYLSLPFLKWEGEELKSGVIIVDAMQVVNTGTPAGLLPPPIKRVGGRGAKIRCAYGHRHAARQYSQPKPGMVPVPGTLPVPDPKNNPPNNQMIRNTD